MATHSGPSLAEKARKRQAEKYQKLVREENATPEVRQLLEIQKKSTPVHRANAVAIAARSAVPDSPAPVVTAAPSATATTTAAETAATVKRIQRKDPDENKYRKDDNWADYRPSRRSVLVVLALLTVAALTFGILGTSFGIVSDNKVNNIVFPNGTIVQYGSGDPDPDFGLPGWYYINEDNGQIWVKTGAKKRYDLWPVNTMAGSWVLLNDGSVMGGDLSGVTTDAIVEMVGNYTAEEINQGMELIFAMNATNSTQPTISVDAIMFPFSPGFSGRIYYTGPAELTIDNNSGGDVQVNIVGSLDASDEITTPLLGATTVDAQTLYANTAEIVSLLSQLINVTNLGAQSGHFQTLTAEVLNLVQLTLQQLNVTNLGFTNAFGSNVYATSTNSNTFTGSLASLNQLNSTNIGTTNVFAVNGYFGTLTADTLTLNSLTLQQLNVTNLGFTNAFGSNIYATSTNSNSFTGSLASLNQVNSTNIGTTNLFATNGYFTTASANTFSGSQGSITQVNSTNIGTTNLFATNGYFTTVTTGTLNLNTLSLQQLNATNIGTTNIFGINGYFTTMNANLFSGSQGNFTNIGTTSIFGQNAYFSTATVTSITAGFIQVPTPLTNTTAAMLIGSNVGAGTPVNDPPFLSGGNAYCSDGRFVESLAAAQSCIKYAVYENAGIVRNGIGFSATRMVYWTATSGVGHYFYMGNQNSPRLSITNTLITAGTATFAASAITGTTITASTSVSTPTVITASGNLVLNPAGASVTFSTKSVSGITTLTASTSVSVPSVITGSGDLVLNPVGSNVDLSNKNIINVAQVGPAGTCTATGGSNIPDFTGSISIRWNRIGKVVEMEFVTNSLICASGTCNGGVVSFPLTTVCGAGLTPNAVTMNYSLGPGIYNAVATPAFPFYASSGDLMGFAFTSGAIGVGVALSLRTSFVYSAV